MLGAGLSLYGNYAINNYSMSTGGSVLQNVPKNTATAGLIYNQGPAYASLIAKEVGQRYSGVDANGNAIPFASYTIVNFASSYRSARMTAWAKTPRSDSRSTTCSTTTTIFASFANDANGNPMFYAVPTRSFMVTLSVDM